MKKLMITSSCIMYALIFTSSIMASRNPVSKTLKISNRTSIPLIVQIESSYPDLTTNQILSEKKTIELIPSAQNNFSFNTNKLISGYSISYSGGPDKLTIFRKDDQDNPIATYTALNTTKGIKYFPALQPYGFSYNLLSIYENAANADSPLYLSYDKINLAMGAA